MNPTLRQTDQGYILYDADALDHVDSAWFEAQSWQQQQAIVGQAQGRGTTWFIQNGQRQWVLRHYRRGGLVAAWLGDRYCWTGLEQTRAFKEWRLLAHLFALGLPVPRPIAARVIRRGLIYRADLILERLTATQSLAMRLQQQPLSKGVWQQLGGLLKRFHAAGVYHADLNAHNILLGDDDRMYLIDFDKGAIRTAGRWQAANLDRLKRSLHKLALVSASFYYNEADFRVLRQAYSTAI